MLSSSRVQGESDSQIDADLCDMKGHTIRRHRTLFQTKIDHRKVIADVADCSFKCGFCKELGQKGSLRGLPLLQ